MYDLIALHASEHLHRQYMLIPVLLIPALWRNSVTSRKHFVKRSSVQFSGDSAAVGFLFSFIMLLMKKQMHASRHTHRL